jgi:hypothetical protein
VVAIENGSYDHLSTKTEQLKCHFDKTLIGDVKVLQKEVEKIAKMRSIIVEGQVVDPVRHIKQIVLSSRYLF